MPLPRPFEHQTLSPLIDEQSIVAPVTVEPVNGLPGLNEAVAAALQQEEIAATTNTGAGYLTLRGHVHGEGASREVLWQVADADGKTIGASLQPMPTTDPTATARLAARSARALAKLLRGEVPDGGRPDNRPRVILRPIRTPPEFDGPALRRAQADALARRGIVVVDDPQAPFAIEALLRILPGSSGVDVVEVSWTVRDAAGKSLGTVSQGGPVPHADLANANTMTPLAAQIALGGAEGIVQVLKKGK
jgi:hypothetical protein